MADSCSCQVTSQKEEQMDWDTRIHVHKWKHIEQLQPDANLVSKLIKKKTRLKRNHSLQPWKGYFSTQARVLCLLQGMTHFGEWGKHQSIQTRATYHSAKVYMRLTQDVTMGPRGTRRTAVGWSDRNDQDGRTQLISDTEMFNGVKVLL